MPTATGKYVWTNVVRCPPREELYDARSSGDLVSFTIHRHPADDPMGGSDMTVFTSVEDITRVDNHGLIVRISIADHPVQVYCNCQSLRGRVVPLIGAQADA